jgi:predicted phosphoserine aminotransferase
MTEVPFERFFLPGPTAVRPEIMAALAGPIISHRGPAMRAMMHALQPPLRRIFRTDRPVLIGAGSGTSFMEAAIRSGVEQRVLVAVGGVFGERFARIAERCGKEVVRVMVPPGRTIEPDHLARFMDHPPVDAVALVHSETSTGALAPLEELARVVRRQPGVMLLVDAVSSLGGAPVETDAWGLDFVFTATQKALAVPPGLALGVASAAMLERAGRIDGRGLYLDVLRLAEAAEHDEPAQTPALPLLYALARQVEAIDREGIEARWQRHRAMAAMVAEWAAARPGFSLVAPEGRRSPTVSAIRPPERVSAAQLIESLGRRGWVVGPGMGELAGAVFRIGHMGDLGVPELEGLLAALDQEPKEV